MTAELPPATAQTARQASRAARQRAAWHAPRHGRPSRHIRGVSLLGALIAVALFAFAAIGATRLHVALQREVTASVQRAAALRLAQSTLESLRRPVSGTPPSSGHPPAVAGSRHSARSAQPAHTVVAGAIDAGTVYTVEQAHTPSAPFGLTTLVVVVHWLGPQGEPQRLSLSTLLAEPYVRWSPALMARRGSGTSHDP